MLYLLSKSLSALTRKERFFFHIALITSLIAGFFVLVNAYYAATMEAPAEGGSFTEGIVGQPTFINPLLSSGNDADVSAIELLYPRLGDLIQTYEIGPDRKTVSVKIKKDLAWDDGTPLTADDVVFTVETAQDILVRSLAAGAWQGVLVEKTNDNELRFTLREPSAFFEMTVRALKIAPRHIFGAIPSSNLRLSAYNLEPVGAGPWKFARLETEKNGFITKLDLVPNPHYAGTQPFIKNFSLRFYPNEESALRAFNAKEIDGLGGVGPDKAKSLAVEHHLASISLPRYYAIFFNRATHPALKERGVRQALALAIDRKKITDDVFHGEASTAMGPIPPQTEGYDATAFQAVGDPVESARQLLDAAGWLVNPEDGMRYKTIGRDRTKLAFTILVPDLPLLIQAMEIVKTEWTSIGVHITTSPMSSEDMQKGPIKTRNYEMAVFGNVLKGNPDVFAFWHSSQKFHPGLNLSMFENKEADLILTDTQKAEKLDMAELKKLQQLIHDDAPAAFLINPNYLYGIPLNLHGFNSEGLIAPSDRLKDAGAWYVRTKRQFKE
ncbi:MAG: peptide ABC transporter substrate-binding protein [bacterium]|nr:peptide ABC transporter substrate-binding protein [bacterium]